MKERVVSVRTGHRPVPPETTELTELVASLLDRYFEECATDTNPSSQGFGLFLMQQPNRYDISCDFSDYERKPS